MSKPVEPTRNVKRNEASTVLIPLTHLDEDNATFTPSTLKYRIDDLTNNRQVLDWTTVSTPSTTNTLTITSTQNALYNRSKPRELRQLTVYAQDSSGNESNDVFHYTLIRIFDRSDQLQ